MFDAVPFKSVAQIKTGLLPTVSSSRNGDSSDNFSMVFRLVICGNNGVCAERDMNRSSKLFTPEYRNGESTKCENVPSATA